MIIIIITHQLCVSTSGDSTPTTLRVCVTLQLHRVLCDSNVTPMVPEYPLLSYITILWHMKPEQKLCRSCVIIGVTPVVLQCFVNVVEMNDIFPYRLSYFGCN